MNNLATVAKVDDIELQHSAYTQLTTHYDKKYKTGWYYMHAQPRSCFTTQLLDEINDYQQAVKYEMLNTKQKQYDYLVLASDVECTFNLGGDLAVYLTAIAALSRTT